jgi:hypothetical protein
MCIAVRYGCKTIYLDSVLNNLNAKIENSRVSDRCEPSLGYPRDGEPRTCGCGPRRGWKRECEAGAGCDPLNWSVKGRLRHPLSYYHSQYTFLCSPYPLRAFQKPSQKYLFFAIHIQNQISCCKIPYCLIIVSSNQISSAKKWWPIIYIYGNQGTE